MQWLRASMMVGLGLIGRVDAQTRLEFDDYTDGELGAVERVANLHGPDGCGEADAEEVAARSPVEHDEGARCAAKGAVV